MRGLLRRAATSETLHGALVLALLLCAFFRTPLARYAEVHYSPADLTQDFSLTKIEPGHPPGNKLMSDAVTQMEPWLMFNRDELRAGRFPLWNPWNGAGCPHFANFQSAVFSPFSLPYYVLGFKAALLASAFLKLWVLGFFTFLYLKTLRLRQIPALLGATIFMFGGHNVVLLYFPHVGAIAALPAGMYFVETAFRRFEAGREGVLAPLAGLAISLAAGLLAGNPEPFYFAVLLVSAYVVARLVALALAAPERRGAVAILGSKLLAASLLAAGLCAFQVLPFFEYLANSRVLEQRSLTQTALDPRFWPLMMFPNALGNPSSAYNLSYSVPPPTFELVHMAYAGGVAVFLAAVSLAFLRRDRYVAFFAGAATVWAFYAYDLFGAARWFAFVPTVGMAPMNRSQAVWIFCIACCAALAANRLLAREGKPAFEAALATALAGIAFLVACLVGADRRIEEFATFPSPNHVRFLDFVPDHVRWMSAVFLAGCAAVVALWLTRARIARLAAGATLLGAVFLQSGWLLRDYNPVTEDRFFFPVTPAIAALRETVGQDRVAILGEDGIPPDSNLAYGLSLIQSYDGMWVRDYDLLYRVMFGDTHNWRPIVRGGERALKMFGVDWVLAKWRWNFLDSGLSRIARDPDQKFAPQEVLPRGEITQTFKCRWPRLQVVAVWLGVHANTRPFTLRFRLEELETGRTICERDVTSHEIAADIYSSRQTTFPLDLQLSPPGRPVVFAFDPEADSERRSYRITLTCPQGTGGHAAIAWSATRRTYVDGESRKGGEPLPGELLFDYSCNADRFELVREIGDFGLYRYKGALGRGWAVRGASVAANDAEAIDLLHDPAFDPGTLVVLSPEIAGATGIAEAPRSRLIKTRDSVKVYYVCADGRSIVHIADEATFLANKFRWDQIETVSDEEFARHEIVDPDLALARRSGLRLVSSPALGESPPKIVAATPTSLRWEVERREPGYLVISQARFPGWKARVNGVDATVHRANYAFSAVELKGGLNVVDFWYDPESFRHGAWISLASAVIGLLCLIRALR